MSGFGGVLRSDCSADGSLLCTGAVYWKPAPRRFHQVNTVSGISSTGEPLKLVYTLRGEQESSWVPELCFLFVVAASGGTRQPRIAKPLRGADESGLKRTFLAMEVCVRSRGMYGLRRGPASLCPR
ncbi:hypothetical protein F7725_027737 [Dissostichus mawsoni]|uniref:Uncharacterized protein n=1 Tax=Dissostichus mawsoni TaxID=36200 RepID=A0A7J5XEQ2_DISMA|nr:hypothetical protein F7725_027737 [Dissostichus mawsoni]